ncbi:elongation factor 4 [candidate division WOR-3 bacterium JGI_Cruoil_03_44_89]|uniref:Elongation factor 4 n=1 Tax=candidate division WOR-3 bacterium JGI_Cruoil_03_44_89 TaxID=1973748 RepID=A0A235C0L5_UNCW3|nr:MAG: elongation factor 4 [candidate division WOR-3 bacterium JGI_Cruoil_03_44_89]
MDKRNFCIIAHIDHGKSTLADRMLEITNTIPRRLMRDQVLDRMELEREHGITIKAHPIRMRYKGYIFNLIDTPGHVDFSYEVTRSLAACEGAVLLVDAVQGVQAQTVSNLYMALDAGLTIIPVINKIDLPNAHIDDVREELMTLLDTEEILLISAKNGWGVVELMDAIIERIPPPRSESSHLRALVFDSYYDEYRGAIPYVRIMSGDVSAGDVIRFFRTGKSFEAQEVGYFSPDRTKSEVLESGDVGYIICNIRNAKDIRTGDTIVKSKIKNQISKIGTQNVEPLPGYREVTPYVYAGVYPADGEDYDSLKEALEKLALTDSSLVFEPETSSALGFGFRCGFLGMLHKKVIEERLEREMGIAIVSTSPNIKYRIALRNGSSTWIENPGQLPKRTEVENIDEPIVRAKIFTPPEYIGKILELCEGKRGIQRSILYHRENMVEIEYEMPLSEIIFDFYDSLKSISCGFASLDYEFIDYRTGDFVKLDILVNGKQVDAFSSIIPRERAYHEGVRLTRRLKKIIPRQLFEVVIQASSDGRIIAKSRIAPIRKDVTAKCYGGDITRKRKLLERQKEGKKKMKRIGMVEMPKEAFLVVRE